MQLDARDNYVGDPTLASSLATTSSQKLTSPASSIYIYNPSQTLAITFTILYAVTIPLYFYLCLMLPRRIKPIPGQLLPVPTDKHKSTIPLLIASLISTTGFILRIISIQPQNLSSILLCTISSSNIVLSPIFICASLYLLLVKLIRRALPSQALGVRVNAQKFLCLSPRWLGLVFISSDILSFITQGAGSAIATGGNWQGTRKDVGTNVLLLGLGLQTATFCLFLIVLAQFCLRVRNHNAGELDTGGERNILVGMWIAGAFILLRSVFRIVEFGMGIDGYPFRHEWMMYVFDAAGVWIALVALAHWHPARWLKGAVDPDVVIIYSPIEADKSQKML